MYEQPPDYFKKFCKNYTIFILNHEPKFSGFILNANFAVSHSNNFNLCNRSIDNEKHYHMMVEFTKESTDLLNKLFQKPSSSLVFSIQSKISFLVASSINFPTFWPSDGKIEKGCQLYLDFSGVPLRRRLPQVCFGLQTKSVQTQTDMITNVTIERFTYNLNGEIAVEFSEIIDIILSGYGCMEIDSNTLYIKFATEMNFNFKFCFSFALLFIKKNVTTPAGGVPEEGSDEQRRVSFCPLKQMAKP